jgi:ELWxxDGT repeat protein
MNAKNIPFGKIELVSDIRSGTSSSSPKYMTTFNGKVYFQANDGTNGIALWVYDGTTTSIVNTGTAEAPTYVASPTAFQVNAAGDKMYFLSGGKLWSMGTDGVIAEAADLSVFGTVSDYHLMGDKVYFSGTQAGDTKDVSTYTVSGTEYTEIGLAVGKELYSYNLTDNTVTLEVVADDNFGLAPHSFVTLGDDIYFVGMNRKENVTVQGFFGPMERLSDVQSVYRLTATGLEVVAEFSSEYSRKASEMFMDMTAVGDKLYFSARLNGDTEVGLELHEFNPATTTLTSIDIFEGMGSNPRTGAEYPLGSTPTELTEFAGNLYFLGSTAENGKMLLEYNTTTGTVTDLGKASGAEGNLNPTGMTVHNGKLYFQGSHGTENLDYVANGDDRYGYGNELYVYDGVNVPEIVTNLRIPTEDNKFNRDALPTNLVSFGDELLFSATKDSQVEGTELFKLNTSTAFYDQDADGVADRNDAFPMDAAASVDSDGDGYPDALVADVETTLVVDAFPSDETEWMDSDGDTVGDNADVFPNDAGETVDFDMDGIGNVADNDDDNDGYSDTLEAE